MAGKEAKTAAEKAAEEKAAAEKKAADEKAAAEKAAAEAATTDDETDDTTPKKKEKTYTKAELEAEKKKAAEEARKKFEAEKDLSELERLQKENEELRAANQLRDAKDSVVDALTKAGARSPELLWKAMKSDLEFDDKGWLKNLDALVTSAKSDFADQFGEPKPDGTIEGGAGQQTKDTGKGLTEEKIKAMTPQEINENWEEVSKAIAKG